jgi:FMN phosphatase YigB (HAD superfamily)
MLDFDGVIFTNRRMLSRVSNRAASFVRETINREWSHAQAMRANEFLYKNYGHTWKGLSTLYEGHRSLPMDYYNAYVYNDGIMKHTRNCINEDILGFRYIQKLCKELDVPIYVVSNAPISWVNSLNEAMGLGIPTTHLLTCDHNVIDGSLKPDPDYYTKAVLFIRDQEHLRYESVEFVIVDDSFYNIKPLVSIQGFKPVLFAKDALDDTLVGSGSKLACVSLLQHVAHFIAPT